MSRLVYKFDLYRSEGKPSQFNDMQVHAKPGQSNLQSNSTRESFKHLMTGPKGKLTAGLRGEVIRELASPVHLLWALYVCRQSFYPCVLSRFQCVSHRYPLCSPIPSLIMCFIAGSTCAFYYLLRAKAVILLGSLLVLFWRVSPHRAFPTVPP